MKRNLLSIALGLVGVLLGLSGWHLWQDHLYVDYIRARVTAQDQAQASRQAQPPPVSLGEKK